jgi:acyl carrier protein
MDSLKLKLKEEIIAALNLPDIKSEDIKDNEELFGEGLGLDSIDSLELIVMIERNYGIKIEDPREGRKALENINAMAEYITLHQK